MRIYKTWQRPVACVIGSQVLQQGGVLSEETDRTVIRRSPRPYMVEEVLLPRLQHRTIFGIGVEFRRGALERAV